MAIWVPRLRLVLSLLLTASASGRAPPPAQTTLRPDTANPPSPPASVSPDRFPLEEGLPAERQDALGAGPANKTTDSARLLVSVISSSLSALHIRLHGNATCIELSGSKPAGGALFSQELLGLVLVPVLVSAGCVLEAQDQVLKLYALLGHSDTQELLGDVLQLLQHRGGHSPTHAAPAAPPATGERHLQALLFNVQQLARVGAWPEAAGHRGRCHDWQWVGGATLLGKAAPGGRGSLEEALLVCRRLGVECAGVTRPVSPSPGQYQVVLRQPGSHVVPSDGQSESWLLLCGAGRVRRHGTWVGECVNKEEERVYKVVEWIPAVSTLYNLGTAVYYASLNCSSMARERAILSAVDLGTDALMAVTGGTVGVAGYALGAGVKTGVKAGVKYLLNTMKEDDLLMNQNSWEDGTLIIQ